MPKVILMSRTSQFVKFLQRRLNEIEPTADWKGQSRIGKGRASADLCGEIGGKPVCIEVEIRRDEPITNVVKFWRAVEKGEYTNKVILVHAFSGHFSKKNTHRVHAEFIGKHMQALVGVRYLSVPFPYVPKKDARACERYRRRAATRLASKIQHVVRAV